MILKGLFIGDTREASTHCLGLLKTDLIDLILLFNSEDDLVKAIINDTGQDSTLHVHCSGLLVDRLLNQYASFT